MDILLFGDQTADQYQVLHKAVHQKSAVLTTFLERVAVALREESSRLSWSRRRVIPDFLRVNDLIQEYCQRGYKVAELESALVTVSQLSHYIGYFEQHPDQLPVLPSTRSIGLCTGLLAASAVASARSLSELIPLAVEVIRIAFRTGTCVGIAKDGLDNSHANRDSWSTIVTNTQESTVQVALDEFHNAAGIDAPHKAYISAVSTMALTISGPPSATRKLFHECDALRTAHRVPIPVYAPYHAPHLYAGDDVSRIIADSSRLLDQFRPVGLIHSASTGNCHQHSSTLGLVQNVLNEILREPVRWDRLLEQTVSQITALKNADCTVTALGVTNVANSLVSALNAGGHHRVSFSDHTAWSATFDYQGHTQHDKIAIVGLSGRFPDAANHEALWDLLMQGLDVHREIPKDRFDAKAHCDPSGKGKNKSHTPYGCFIDEPGLFDPRFFNMSPREAAQTDPMGRLGLVTAYEALEMSGYIPNRTPSTKLHRIGTFYGQTSDDWREINAAENVDTYFITGGVRAFAPGRINYFFKFSGPSFSIDTACSSSLAAIQLACTSLWAGDCDTACAGGLNVLTNPDIFSGLSKGQFLSKTGSCKTYDNEADGYCRGDGCGSVILKRYEDAIAEKDPILGCILSAGTNHSAEAVSITHPHAGAQEFLYKRVLADAGVDAHDISYVEMHGTGTQAGDGIEMTSVTNTFAPPHRRRQHDQPLYLGAIKANIGHGEAASGINSMAKVLMMFQKNAIPPNVGVKGVMNKTFPKDLYERNVHIPQEVVAWPRQGFEKRLIFLNNFSAAGGNTSLLLEDPPLRTEPQPKDPRSHQIITVTARAISSLKKNIGNLVKHLDENPGVHLSSLAYTTTARRIQHNYRVAFNVSNVSQVREGLLAQIKDSYSPVSMAPNTAAFAFTGQGSQYTGFGQHLYQTVRSFRDNIDWLNNLACTQGLPSFLPLLRGTELTALTPTVVQLGMSCIQVALARMWMSWGLQPVAVIGHSLGEYAALHIADVISASDMIRIVGRRAELLVSLCAESSHGMLAVKGSQENIAHVLGAKMTEIACKNGPEETVLSGSLDQVNTAKEVLEAQGLKATILQVPFAFHSAQMEPILDPLRRVASSIVFNKPSIPVLSPLLGDVICDAGSFNPEYLSRHAREPVDFRTALVRAQDAKVFSDSTAWLEVGAHPVCSNMIKNSLGSSQVIAPTLRRGEDPWKTITSSLATLFLAGVYINFDEYHRDFSSCYESLILPTYSFDNKNYWLDYHHNWTLTKGEAPVTPRSIETPLRQPSTFSTTSCQHLVREDLTANSGTAIFQTDLTEPKLQVAVTGHRVNENPLCPSSLYADQALTVADYLHKQLRPKAPQAGLNVCKMEVAQPLIAKEPPPAEGQHIQIEGNADLDNNQVVVKWRSVTPDGVMVQEHAHCLVKLENMNEWRENWNMTSFMVRTQIDLLQRKLNSGSAHKTLRGMTYKLFKNFVDYAPPFRGMEEVTINENDTEGSSIVAFQADERDGNFIMAPYWIDSLCHISGYLLNGTGLLESEDSLFISHGWGSMRFAKTLSAKIKYTSYVRMLPQPKNVRCGDVYIFEGDEIVGVVGGLKFQEIPRRIMNAMLPPPKRAGATVSNTTPARKPLTATSKPASGPARAQVSIEQTSKLSKPKPMSNPGGGATVSKVMKIIAEETDVNPSELVDAEAFENLGVDSLLSLTISAKLREELDMDIPSTLFTDNETIGALKKYFSQFDGVTTPAGSSDTDSSDDSDLNSPDNDGEISTPPSSPPSVSDSDDSPDFNDGQPSIARQVISEEMGIDLEELTDKLDLADTGMDSLMSLTVLSSLRERTGADLPSSFFIDNNTVEDIEKALGMRPKTKLTGPKSEKPRSAAKQRAPQLDAVSAKLQQPKRDLTGYPNATSVLLQGSAKTAAKKLFLFPDGSGSATSYINIPNLGRDVAIYGLNCPFMKTPEKFLIGIDGVATLYLNEMKRRQPQGPYIIGGWSAGGVLAYEIACQLLAAGDKIEKLILLDSPCPVKLEPLPARLHHFFDQIGLLGSGGMGSSPDWLLPHFEYSIKALAEYQPRPMPQGAAPKAFAIWAREGVCGKPGDPRPPPAEDEDPKPMKWLLDDRTDFGDNGWAQLLGEGMQFAQMDGNHFTMTREENSAVLGRLIKQGLDM